MVTQAEKVAEFRGLHRTGEPLLLANAWDIGSARFLAGLGFRALATTSSGFAATLGRRDYRVTRDEALAHAQALVEATDVPVSADLENCFADDPAGVADTIERAVANGLAGCSIEDFTGDRADPIYALDLATERVAAAAEAAHASGDFVLTARSENFLHGRQDLADTILRLQRFQEAGADVLYAPALVSLDDIRSVVSSVDRPVNVLTVPGLPSVAELASVGFARISVGGAFAFAALGAVAAAGRELLDEGTYGWMQGAGAARSVIATDFET
ncbi:MAG: isocitrate lyase/phosphoenolpyruvate mutase family protein [Actinobacteria bacterium]|nr:MAG: isocitrate lyase/phosphoenolpyruvate mutase family protein [Actinomycetota bacterium]